MSIINENLDLTPEQTAWLEVLLPEYIAAGQRVAGLYTPDHGTTWHPYFVKVDDE